MSLERNKEELLSLIGQAKSAHIRWRSYAQGMVSGVQISEERLPMKHTECKFGQWYYGEGKRLLGEFDAFKEVEAPHEMLHAVYGQIHELVVKLGDKQRARDKLEELVAISRTLLEKIDTLEQEVNALEK